jgi:hypothetical protein
MAFRGSLQNASAVSGCGWRFKRLEQSLWDLILEILQALALSAGILKTVLEIVEEVERIRREHKAS